MRLPDYSLSVYHLTLCNGTNLEAEIQVQLDLLPGAGPYDASESVQPGFGAWRILAGASELILAGYRLALPFANYVGPATLQPGSNTLKWSLPDTVPTYSLLAAWINALPISEGQNYVSGIWQFSRMFNVGSLGYCADLQQLSVSGDRIE